MVMPFLYKYNSEYVGYVILLEGIFQCKKGQIRPACVIQMAGHGNKVQQSPD